MRRSEVPRASTDNARRAPPRLYAGALSGNGASDRCLRWVRQRTDPGTVPGYGAAVAGSFRLRTAHRLHAPGLTRSQRLMTAFPQDQSMKMNRNYLRLSALAIAMAVALPVLADSTVTVTKTKHNYVYYRDHDIYYGPETKTYYWQAGGKWQSGPALPEEDQLFVKSGGVEVELDTDRPYERHDYIVSHYKNTAPDGDTTLTERTVAKSADGSSTTTTTTTTKHKYVYYGDHDIYFAPEIKTYYWLVDGKWESGAELPLADRSYITSGGVTIELDTDRPYTRHEYVVAHYKHKNDRKDD
jgi:hypothetical protein